MSKLDFSSPLGGSSQIAVVGSAAKFGDVAGGNYAEFQENGFLRLYGDGRAWIDWNFDGASLARGSAAPGLVSWNGSRILLPAFNGVNTLEFLSKVIEANHEWAEGTVLKAHLHWMATTAAAGNVQWYLEYIAIEGNTSTVLDTLDVTSAANGAWNEVFSAFDDIVLAETFDIGTQLGFALYRDPGAANDDTYGADAALLTVGLHVLVDGLGSCQVAVKECAE